MLKVDYNCTYKIKNFKYKISRLLKNDPHLIKFETSTINTSGFALLAVPVRGCAAVAQLEPVLDGGVLRQLAPHLPTILPAVSEACHSL